MHVDYISVKYERKKMIIKTSTLDVIRNNIAVWTERTVRWRSATQRRELLHTTMLFTFQRCSAILSRLSPKLAVCFTGQCCYYTFGNVAITSHNVTTFRSYLSYLISAVPQLLTRTRTQIIAKLSKRTRPTCLQLYQYQLMHKNRCHETTEIFQRCVASVFGVRVVFFFF